jgi:two-component system, NarL family, sensor kinase
MDAKEITIYQSILIASVIIGVIIAYFITSMIRQQRRQLRLQRENIINEINTLEKERARIAGDLHDELGPRLAAIKMKIGSFELTDEQDIIQAKKTTDNIDEVLKRMREISFDLMPTSLLRKGFVPALKEFISYLGNDNIKFTAELEDIAALPDNKAINMYRIVQEVAHNSIKHSKATEFIVKLKNENKKIVLTLSYNGVGFDTKKVSEAIGFGLRGMSSRCEMIGGQMFLESEKNKGTSYQFEIPV